jgi:hypothetical protein
VPGFTGAGRQAHSFQIIKRNPKTKNEYHVACQSAPAQTRTQNSCILKNKKNRPFYAALFQRHNPQPCPCVASISFLLLNIPQPSKRGGRTGKNRKNPPTEPHGFIVIDCLIRYWFVVSL